MDDISYMKYFVDEVILPRRNPIPGLKKEWRSGLWAKDGWYDWGIFESSVSNREIEQIESDFCIKVPTCLRVYFTYKIIFDFDCGIIRMPEMTPSEPLKNFISCLEMLTEYPSLSNNNLIPFCFDGNDAGLVCYKSSESELGEGVFILDHELLNDQKYCGDLRWSSVREMFEKIEQSVRSYEN